MTRGLPPFTKEGLLPPGDYTMTLAELKKSILVEGPPKRVAPGWDRDWRAGLVENLGIMVRQLWRLGIENVFVDGSFVEAKDHPNDIDGYFECEREELISGRLEAKLNRLDPRKVWTWSPSRRRPYPGSPKKQLPMWHTYRVELWPHFGQPAGIRDEHGNELEFPAAFRKSRLHQPRGVIQLLRTP